jgi:hypothetical protein
LAIFSRIPRWEKIASVYAVIVLMIYGWTILWFFWKLPSWLYFLTVWEILSALSFSLATNFLESLLVLSALLLACIILPRKWFYDVFVARGCALAISGLGYMMLLANQFQLKMDYPGVWLAWTPAVLAIIVLISVIVSSVPFMRKELEAMAERLTVFLFISLPLSVFVVISAAFQVLS